MKDLIYEIEKLFINPIVFRFSSIIGFLIIERVSTTLTVIGRCKKLKINSNAFTTIPKIYGAIGYAIVNHTLKILEQWDEGNDNIFIMPSDERIEGIRVYGDTGGLKIETGTLIADLESGISRKVTMVPLLYDESETKVHSKGTLLRTPYNYSKFIKKYKEVIEEKAANPEGTEESAKVIVEQVVPNSVDAGENFIAEEPEEVTPKREYTLKEKIIIVIRGILIIGVFIGFFVGMIVAICFAES